MPVVRDAFDWSNTQPSTAVVETVTEAQGQEPTSTEPLYRAIDTDALDDLMRSGDGDVRVEFAFEGHRVTVEDDGTVIARPDLR